VPLKADDGKTYSMVSSGYDDDYYYYIYLLGHIERVPVVYSDAYEYDGTTTWSFSYEEGQCTEESVEESMSTTMENSVTNTVTNSWATEVEVGFEKGPFSASVSETYTHERSKEEMKSRSTSNTLTTAKTKINTETSSVSYTIGENNEPPGKYRYTLFGTTDVYYQLITNKNFEFVEASTIACARPPVTLYWGIDYDPDPSGDFGKTAKSKNLAIPDLDLSELSKPAIKIEDMTTPLTTVWTKTITDDAHQITSTNAYIERFKTDLDLVELQNAGYTTINIKVDFEAKRNGSNILVAVNFPTSETGTDNSIIDKNTGAGNDWETFTFNGSTDIRSFFNHMSILHANVTYGGKDITVSNRTYTITARK
jgi:hypothetical protein